MDRRLSPLELLALVKYSLHEPTLSLLWDASAGSELLCYALDLLLTTAWQRQKKRLLSWGDKEHRRFSRKRDLIQQPITADDLPRGPYKLCERLLKEVLVVIHLLRGARYFAHLHNPIWQLYHQHAAIALSRLYTTWLKLRQETSPWVASTCLRWALGEAWKTLFGPTADLPERLKEQDVPLWAEWEAYEVVSDPRRAARDMRIPRPLEPLVAQWRRHYLPLRPPAGEAWPEAHTSRFKV